MEVSALFLFLALFVLLGVTAASCDEGLGDDQDKLVAQQIETYETYFHWIPIKAPEPGYSCYVYSPIRQLGEGGTVCLKK